MAPLHPYWFDTAPPSKRDCVIPRILDLHAAVTPDRNFIRFQTGESWSWGETRIQSLKTAAALQARGVEKGDVVAACAPNGPALLKAWFGANYLGAAIAPINTSFRGRLLEHAINSSGARLLILHPDLAPRLEGLSLPAIQRIILTGGASNCVPLGAPAELASALDGVADQVTTAEVEPWDTPVIIFTSGTTGPSKGVITTYVQAWTTGRITYGYMNRDDRMLVNLPMFHVGGISPIIAALACGGSVALFESFDTSRFWAQVRETKSTTCSGFIGALSMFLQKETPRSDDRENSLRMCTLSPIDEGTVALSKRFGIDYVSGFNMTEVSCPLITDVNEPTVRSCGRPRSGVECRIVDDNDYPVIDGEVGELVIRTTNPWELFKGYLGNPVATSEAWRNGWFHTGDLLRRDLEGRYYFVDRKKDAIRRRGENMSSFEIENEVCAYPDVREVAAYGVDAPGGEQEVMVCIAPRAGAIINPRDLIEFLIPRMAHFMVPRYVRIEAALPKTPTNKIQKVDLRTQGVTEGTWDREAAGITVRRQKLGAN